MLVLVYSEESTTKQKRYPLELGLASWDSYQLDKDRGGDNSTDVQFVKTNQQTPHYRKQDSERKHFRSEWVPGKKTSNNL